MTVSAYVRFAALRSESARVVEVDAPLLREVHADLKHTGSNLNQIARHLNTYGPGSVPDEVVGKALASVADATRAASDVLAAARG